MANSVIKKENYITSNDIAQYVNLQIGDGIPSSAVSSFRGQYTKIGRAVTFSVNITTTAEIASGIAFIKGLPAGAEGNVSFLAMRNTAFSTFYSLRLSGNNLYVNMAFPAGEYAITGAYVAAYV